MKRLFAALLCTAMVLTGGSVWAAGTVYLEEAAGNFDKAGVTYTDNEAPPEWITGASKFGGAGNPLTYETGVAGRTAQDRSLYLATRDNTDVLLWHDYTVENVNAQYYIAEFSVMIPQNALHNDVILKLNNTVAITYPNTGIKLFPPTVRFGSDGYLYAARVGAVDAAQKQVDYASTGFQYQTGRWYHLALELQKDSTKAVLYVDGEKVTDENWEMLGIALSRVGGIQFWPNRASNTANGMYIDDVRLYTADDAYVPEKACAAVESVRGAVLESAENRISGIAQGTLIGTFKESLQLSAGASAMILVDGVPQEDAAVLTSAMELRVTGADGMTMRRYSLLMFGEDPADPTARTLFDRKLGGFSAQTPYIDNTAPEGWLTAGSKFGEKGSEGQEDNPLNYVSGVGYRTAGDRSAKMSAVNRDFKLLHYFDRNALSKKYYLAECSVYPESLSGNKNIVFKVNNSEKFTGASAIWPPTIQFNQDGYVYIAKPGAENGLDTIKTDYQYQPGEWYHVAVEYDVKKTTVTVYIDGEQLACGYTMLGSSLMDAGGVKLELSKTPDGNVCYLDDVKLSESDTPFNGERAKPEILMAGEGLTVDHAARKIDGLHDGMTAAGLKAALSPYPNAKLEVYTAAGIAAEENAPLSSDMKAVCYAANGAAIRAYALNLPIPVEAVRFYQNSIEPAQELTDMTGLAAGDTVIASLNAQLEGRMILALFQGESLTAVAQSIEGGDSLQAELVLPVDFEPARCRMRAFVWDDMKDMVPLRGTAELMNAKGMDAVS